MMEEMLQAIEGIIREKGLREVVYRQGGDESIIIRLGGDKSSQPQVLQGSV
jgi:hypothetical protein